MNARTVPTIFMMYVDLHGIILVLNLYVLNPVPRTVLTKYLMPQQGKVIVRILRSPHRRISCENGIWNHDTTPIQYEKRTIKNSPVINENDKNNFRIFRGSSTTDGERYDFAYAFSTEAKDMISLENSDNLKLVPETNPQVQKYFPEQKF